MSLILRTKVFISPQIFYDSLILGLTNEKDRPKCPICGNNLEFISISHGYPRTCSKNCHSELKRDNYNRISGMTKKGDRLSDELKQKISLTLTGRVESKETREKKSKYMKEFAKTEEGKRFYRNIGKIVSETNQKILSGEKTINTKTGYYVSSRFKRGIFDLTTFGKTINYDSGWEKAFLEYFMDESNISEIEIFDRCKQRIPYIDFDGKERMYSPDFFIKFKSGIRLVIEIKPDILVRTDETVKLKIQSGNNFYKDKKNIKYMVLTEKDFLKRRNGLPIVDKDKFNINSFNN